MAQIHELGCGDHGIALVNRRGEHLGSEEYPTNERRKADASWGGSEYVKAYTKMRYEALKRLLDRLVKEGKISEAEAAKTLKDFERDNKDYLDVPEPIDVTEEFKKSQPIRVYIPEKVEVER